MERQHLILTKEQAINVVYGDHRDFITVSDEITDTTRWSEHHRVVVKRKSDGRFFSDNYSVGLTEMQDESPYDYTEPSFVEVFPTQKTITVYE